MGGAREPARRPRLTLRRGRLTIRRTGHTEARRHRQPPHPDRDRRRAGSPPVDGAAGAPGAAPRGHQREHGRPALVHQRAVPAAPRACGPATTRSAEADPEAHLPIAHVFEHAPALSMVRREGALSSSQVTSTRSRPSPAASSSASRRAAPACPRRRADGLTEYPMWPPTSRRKSLSACRRCRNPTRLVAVGDPEVRRRHPGAVEVGRRGQARSS
ncbi:hypothetical protein [Nocardioides convexus]|uniref:hypothetical protein n=1 Tax=Nocardioides convexus TaxID=2712224 RepID=UPI002418374D|nr:hypothetical protein [Nocardioides convexus]